MSIRTDHSPVCLIVNPAAQSGRGAQAAHRVEQLLRQSLPGIELSVLKTTGPGHARELVAQAVDLGAQHVLALGGDGLVHELAAGLMAQGHSAGSRPVLGVLPMGSGNDFARTLGMTRPGLVQAVAQILDTEPAYIDVGLVNGHVFVQTLSFGLDAEIGLRSMHMRKKLMKASGTPLFMTTGFEVFIRRFRAHAYTATLTGAALLDGRAGLAPVPVIPSERLSALLPEGFTAPAPGVLHFSGQELVFAVQLGPSYGGGFAICPAADPCDGAFDICVSTHLPSRLRALGVFVLARFGRHVRSQALTFARAQQLTLDFEIVPPCQADGEPVPDSSHFEVSLLPGALRVLAPGRN